MAHTPSTHAENAGPDRLAWVIVLVIQSVPYASSLIVSLASAFPLPARLLGTRYRPMSSPGRPAGSARQAPGGGPGGLSPCATGRLRAIVSMLAAVAAFSGMDALLKLLVGELPADAGGGAARRPCALPFLLRADAAERPLAARCGRGACPCTCCAARSQVLVLGGFIYAVRALSLANAYAVFLSAPLIMTALSVPILKERTDARRLARDQRRACSGCCIMLRPSASGLVSLGSLAALISAIAYAVSGITVRVLTRTDTTASVVVWTISLMTVFAGSSPPPHWVTLEPRHYRWLLLLGAPGGRRLLPADGGVPLGAGRGGGAAGVHRAAVGHPDRPRGLARAALGARVLGRCGGDRQRAVPDLARAAPGGPRARRAVMEVAQPGRAECRADRSTVEDVARQQEEDSP